MKIHYPERTKPAMRNYRVKPLKIIKRQVFRKYRKNKYNAHKWYYDHHWYDSKDEMRYATYLNLHHIKFVPHPRKTTIPHTEFKSKIDGRLCSVNKRNYTPDFILYNARGKVIEVDDIKGISHYPSYDSLRMDLYSLSTGYPVTIVRYKHGQFEKKTRNIKKRQPKR